MNRQITLSVLLFFSVCTITSAQTVSLTPEPWNDKPALHTVNDAFRDASAIVILQKKRFEYADEKGGEVAEYYTQHDIIHVNDEKGIASYNRIYLGATNSIEIVDVKARTILPGGKIIEVDKANIKDIKEQDGNEYKIFAMEGLEKGCEVEYYYTYKRSTSFFGRAFVQGPFPVEESYFEIIAPERLIFELKSYNTVAVISDTVIKEKHFIQTRLTNINAVEEEKYASYQVNLERLEYKLSYNNAIRKGERLFTWNEMVKRIYSNYTTIKDKEQDKVGSFIKQNGWDKLKSEEEKIIVVENYLKKNIATRNDIEGENTGNLESILKNKIASIAGIMRLYGEVFRQLNINFQFVFVGDRNNSVIDKTFENWNNCELAVLYFPGTGKYLAPSRPDFRYPYIYPSWGATNGVYFKSTSIGNFTTAIADVKEVKQEEYSRTFSNIESTIELNTSLDTLLIDMKQSYGGYTGQLYKASYTFSDAEERRLFLKEMVKFGTNTENIISSDIQNSELESTFQNTPFILHAKVKATELLEKAGNKKILIKVGEIIGPQVEMYQEKPRQLPVKIEYPHFENRKIIFIIPDGYTVKNMEDLKMENIHRENGEITMGFSSDYELKGNILTINIAEEYKKTFYPVSQFDEFRKIINTSADFNKKVLVLEKMSK